ncbi:hypothetical protein IMG5_084990 [Ichthyophthirius multifiliis]|uniref:Uncharacterized protein n=1 Tax=Ichthyophthirius multifiliis TaxID=5932 RepID=G0QQX0_ICHMU|nr:hypothetical protein IMG5_084990 [Ichthyophthirius multifiliis]EGR32400.1 hypothetical protein IMG5_084990 [Ichthyophthirius multifiliis]|eukprot:XP_004035886.1 hypothetical protein IMG5_084990 [Ichthyophthirius multifiliis]
MYNSRVLQGQIDVYGQFYKDKEAIWKIVGGFILQKPNWEEDIEEDFGKKQIDEDGFEIISYRKKEICDIFYFYKKKKKKIIFIQFYIIIKQLIIVFKIKYKIQLFDFIIKLNLYIQKKNIKIIIVKFQQIYINIFQYYQNLIIFVLYYYMFKLFQKISNYNYFNNNTQDLIQIIYQIQKIILEIQSRSINIIKKKKKYKKLNINLQQIFIYQNYLMYKIKNLYLILNKSKFKQSNKRRINKKSWTQKQIYKKTSQFFFLIIIQYLNFLIINYFILFIIFKKKNYKIIIYNFVYIYFLSLNYIIKNQFFNKKFQQNILISPFFIKIKITGIIKYQQI